MPDIATLIQNTGVPTALLIGLLYIIYRLGYVVIDKIFLPLATAHISFVNVASVNMEKISQSQDALHDRIDAVLKPQIK